MEKKSEGRGDRRDHKAIPEVRDPCARVVVFVRTARGNDPERVHGAQ